MTAKLYAALSGASIGIAVGTLTNGGASVLVTVGIVSAFAAIDNIVN